MPEENENTVQDQNYTPPAAPEREEGNFQVFTPEENGERPLEIRELPPEEPGAVSALPEEEPLFQKVEQTLDGENLPPSFRKEAPPEPLPLSRAEEKGEQSLLLPLEGLEEEAKEPRKEQAPVLSGNSVSPVGVTPAFVRKSVSLPMECGSSLGELLAEARKRAGLTLEEVRELTKIRQENILALEENKLDELPPAVFVAAYTRTLQELYGLDTPSRERVTEALDKLLSINEKEAPSHSGEAHEMKNKILKEISSTVKVNLEEERKFRITAFCVLGGLVLFFILVTILILFLIFGGKKSAAPESGKEIPPFRAENISTLIPAVVPEVQKMELPGKQSTGKNTRR